MGKFEVMDSRTVTAMWQKVKHYLASYLRRIATQNKYHGCLHTQSNNRVSTEVYFSQKIGENIDKTLKKK